MQEHRFAPGKPVSVVYWDNHSKFSVGLILGESSRRNRQKEERSSLNQIKQNWPDLTQLKLVGTAVRYHEDPWMLGAAERRHTAVTSPPVTLAWWIHHDSERKTHTPEEFPASQRRRPSVTVCNTTRRIHHPQTSDQLLATVPHCQQRWPQHAHVLIVSSRHQRPKQLRDDC